MSRDTPRHLFVYGTLMRAAGHPMHAVIAAHAAYCGAASLAGELYFLGSYPGAVIGSRPYKRVHGELYALARPMQALPALDAYEDCPTGAASGEFVRVAVWVRRATGGRVRAWAYLLNIPTHGLTPIRSGDYRSFLKPAQSGIAGADRSAAWRRDGKQNQ
jgi:gamma-glutamylcyclotransferase (GGCT)/AIG2-like uncharacterized protein YtfP